MDLSRPLLEVKGGIEPGGETERREAVEVETRGVFELKSGSGRDPTGGMWAGTLVGGALIPLGPPIEDEALITAAAALGVVKLLRGTKGV